MNIQKERYEVKMKYIWQNRKNRYFNKKIDILTQRQISYRKIDILTERYIF